MAQLAKFPVKKNSTQVAKPSSAKYNKRKKQYLEELPEEGNGWWDRRLMGKDIKKR